MPGIGRPKRISREVLGEAATELFLERGYAAVSVDDIAKTAGVSRATFFNYFSAKVDVLFVEIDAALDELERLRSSGMRIDQAVALIAAEADSRDVPLIARQAVAMGAQNDVVDAMPARIWRLRELVGSSIPDVSWQWAVAGAIAYGAYVWAQDPSTGLDQSISKQISHLFLAPETVSIFVR